MGKLVFFVSSCPSNPHQKHKHTDTHMDTLTLMRATASFCFGRVVAVARGLVWNLTWQRTVCVSTKTLLARDNDLPEKRQFEIQDTKRDALRTYMHT